MNEENQIRVKNNELAIQEKDHKDFKSLRTGVSPAILI
jgi:hypothetical protein